MRLPSSTQVPRSPSKLMRCAAGVLEGFNVTGFGAALIGSVIYSLCGMVIDVAIERLFEPQRLT